MPINEELLDHGGQRTIWTGGLRSDVLTLFLPDVRKEQVVWGWPGLPVEGEWHPTDPALSARQLNATEVPGRAGTIVRVQYTTTDLIYFGKPPPEPGLDVQWETTWREEIVEVPTAVRKTIIDTDNKSKDVWDYFIDGLRETRMVVTVRWRFNGRLEPGTMGDMLFEFNKIHLINLQWWLFKGATLSIVAQDVYDFRGTWELDPGTLAGPISPNPSRIRYAGDLDFATGSPFLLGFLRPPYFQLQWVPPPAPAAPTAIVQPIQLFLRPLHEISVNGAQNIPGWPF